MAEKENTSDIHEGYDSGVREAHERSGILPEAPSDEPSAILTGLRALKDKVTGRGKTQEPETKTAPPRKQSVVEDLESRDEVEEFVDGLKYGTQVKPVDTQEESVAAFARRKWGVKK